MKKINIKKQKYIKQLGKLVSFETLTGNFAENKKALDYVVSLIGKSAYIERSTNEGFEFLIASNKTSKSADFVFLVHMDVVSAQKSQFKMKKQGARLIGRGVSDMKFSIPMGIALLNKVLKESFKTSFSLVITTDEEIGGFKGGKFLVEDYGLTPKCLIVPDGGDNLVFVEKAKGVCQLEITATGSPAHSSRPWDGESAINKLIKLSSKLLDVYEKNSLKANWNTTMNIGTIEGGVSTNQVCAKANMKIDFRYPETDSIEKIKKLVSSFAKKIDASIEIKTMSTGLPTFTDKSNELVKLFLNTMQKSVGRKIKVKETYGASDARHFAKLKVPVLMIKPVGGEIHSDSEWISLSSCLKYYNGLEKFIEKYEKN